MLLYYLEFLELGAVTCEASASSILREGDWDLIRDMISPGFRPTARAGTVPGLSRASLPVDSLPTTDILWVHKD